MKYVKAPPQIERSIEVTLNTRKRNTWTHKRHTESNANNRVSNTWQVKHTREKIALHWSAPQNVTERHQDSSVRYTLTNLLHHHIRNILSWKEKLREMLVNKSQCNINIIINVSNHHLNHKNSLGKHFFFFVSRQLMVAKMNWRAGAKKSTIVVSR